MKTTRRQRFLVALLAAGLLAGCARKEEAPLPAPPAAPVSATNQAAAKPVPKPGFEKLIGKWQRPDGGYILEIRKVESDGKMDAGYFNPKPINVAKAEASVDGAALRLFIELRDVNYPGSTYTLAYDATSDQLAGIYYQAALQQQFEVLFERTK
jgi:hypothetical protein